MAQNDVFIVYMARNNLWLLKTIHVRPKKIFWGHFFAFFLILGETSLKIIEKSPKTPDFWSKNDQKSQFFGQKSKKRQKAAAECQSINRF